MNHGDFMKPNNFYKIFLTSLTLLTILACNALVPVTSTPPTAPMIPTATIAVTARLLSQQVTLTSQPYKETNQTPPFTITSQTPQLTGSNDPRVQSFNQRLNDLVSKEGDMWRQSFLQNTAPTV